MKELGETIGSFALIFAVMALFLMVATILCMMWVSDPFQNEFLLEMLILEIAIFIFTYGTAWILSDDVWDKNKYHERN